MPITVTCHCGAQFRAKDEHAGRQTRCPQCGETMTIPLEADAADDYADNVDAFPEVDDDAAAASGSARGSRWSFKRASGETLLGMNRTCGTVMLLLGLVMVLVSRGCSTLAGRSKSSAAAKYQLLQNEFSDKQAAKRADVEETIAELNETRTDLRNQIVDVQRREERDAIQKQLSEIDKKLNDERKSLRKIEADSLKEQRRLQRGKWREQYESARDSSLYKSTGSYWREWMFVIGTVILAIGLLTVGFTGRGAERTICLIMIAIITFSLYIGGVAWLDAIYDSVESTRRVSPRLLQPDNRVEPIGRKRF